MSVSEHSDFHVGLACGGGAIGGAVYEIGVLYALEEAIRGLDLGALDVYVGVSSGALVTSLLANDVSAYSLSRAVISEAEPELNIQPEVLFRPAYGEYGRRLRRVPDAVLRAFQGYVRRPLDLSVLGVLAGLGPLMPAGIFTNAPLERYLAAAFEKEGRTNDFRALRSQLCIVATHLDSARLVCFGSDRTDVPISRAVQASTALPVFYCPVEVDGEYYIDGVARRTVHASVALEAGVRLLFCINPIVPVDTRAEAAFDRAVSRFLVDYGLPTVLEQTFRTIVYSRMRAGFKRYQHLFPEADIILVEPHLDAYEMFFMNIFSFSNRHDVCEQAYRATRAYLHGNADAIDARLRRHGMSLRRSLLADADRSLFGPRHGRGRAPVAVRTQETLLRLERLIADLEEAQA